jgi:putative component of toxin-antitoxin plasmid stabilization module
MEKMVEVRRFVTQSGRDVIGEWMADLNDVRASAKINARIA